MSYTTTRPRRVLAGLALAPLALGLVACGSGDDTAAAPSETVTVTESSASDSSSTETTTPSAGGSGGSGGSGSSGGDEQGLLAAATTALAEVDGTLVTVDRDDNGWDVTVVAGDGTESDLDLSSDGATVERGPDTDDNDADDRREQQRLVRAAQLDYLAAIDAARPSADGGTLIGVDLDEDNGRVEWDVDFRDGRTERTVTIDASNGQVIGSETDRDDDNDDD